MSIHEIPPREKSEEPGKGISMSKINFQELLTEARYLDTKPPEEHNMTLVFCGTTSCAIGDIAIRNGRVAGRSSISGKDYNLFSITFLGLSEESSAFLFACGTSHWYSGKKEFSRASETPQQTAARLRKFVYYKLRKAEIFTNYNEGLKRGRHLYQGENRVDSKVLNLVEVGSPTEGETDD